MRRSIRYLDATAGRPVSRCAHESASEQAPVELNSPLSIASGPSTRVQFGGGRLRGDYLRLLSPSLLLSSTCPCHYLTLWPHPKRLSDACDASDRRRRDISRMSLPDAHHNPSSAAGSCLHTHTLNNASLEGGRRVYTRLVGLTAR
jgi:hypothetical protein